MTSSTAFAVLAFLYFAKSFSTVCIQGAVRLRSKRFARPEDAAYWKGESNDHPVAARAQSVLRNDLENVVPFVLLCGAFLVAGGAPEAAVAYGSVFFCTRALHTWAYLVPRQPLRNLSYQAGLLVTFVVGVHLAIILG